MGESGLRAKNTELGRSHSGVAKHGQGCKGVARGRLTDLPSNSTATTIFLNQQGVRGPVAVAEKMKLHLSAWGENVYLSRESPSRSSGHR